MRFSQGPLAAALCFTLVASSTPGWPSPTPEPAGAAPDRPADARPEYRGQVQGDTRILHALNRFTFGPRPGDLESVRAMGLDRWFDLQLHPAAIDNSALHQRLAESPAMQWGAADLLYRLPSNAVIRQVIDGKAPEPDRGALHAIYENQVFRVSTKRQQKQKQQAAAAAQPNTMNEAGPPTASIDQTAAGDAQPSTMMAADAPPAPPAFDPQLVPAVLNLPPRPRVLRLIEMQPPEFESFFKELKGPQRAALTADLTPDLKLTVEALQNPQRTVAEELMSERLTRDIYSSAQLQEVMTDFWLNHFNVYLRKNEATPYYLVSYERDVIRPRALGKFEDLLEATAHSPAMMLYLDNAESIGPDSPQAERAKLAAARNPAKNKKAPEGLNENYARELMELHTLGVNGGYTQADVIQAARILTGWTVDRPQRGGGFKFDENRHEPGAKKVLGRKFKEHGEQEGRDLLHLLATRPATAHFISTKLAIRFVSDNPPPALVDRMAKAYLASDGDIATVLKTMFRSPEFWSQDVYRAKVKTPLEYVVSAARASNANLTNMQPLFAALRDMGMPLYQCIPPTGYKWDAADWVSTGSLVNRMNFALSLAANRLNGITTTWSQQAATLNQNSPDSALNLLSDLDSKGAPIGTAPAVISAPGAPSMRGTSAHGWDTTNPNQTTPQLEEARLESLLVAGGVSDSTRTAVLQQFEQQTAQTGATAMPVAMKPNQQRNAPPIEKQDQVLAGLLLGSPEFQRR